MRMVSRARHGTTLVLVALLITVLTGLTAFAVDLSRVYALRAQLKVVTDAAALSEVTDLGQGVTDKALADTRALQLRRSNLVEQRALTDAEMQSADLESGRWDRTTQTFTPSSWSSANAVRATARFTTPWLLARVFGVSQKHLVSSSVAALGSPRWTGCFKPWAIPYSNLLATLGRLPTDTSYRLSSSDVVVLRDNRTPIAFKITSGTVDGGDGTVGGTAIGGNYYAVRFPPVQYADGTPGDPLNGGKDYRTSIADRSCAATGTAAVGDWLDIEQGNMSGPTLQGVRELCGASGQSFNCNTDILVPVWSQRSTRSGSTWVQILYIGAFKLTRYDRGQITGRLLSLAQVGPGGGYTPFPGPITTIALVE